VDAPRGLRARARSLHPDHLGRIDLVVEDAGRLGAHGAMAPPWREAPSGRRGGTTGWVSTPALTWQPSLFASEDAGVDGSFGALRRVQLDGLSWVDHCPGWVVGSDAAFDELVGTVPWTQRRRWMYDREVDEPRLTWWQRVDDDRPLEYPLLEQARAALSARYGIVFDSVGMNLYRGGADSVAWHRDRIPKEIVDPVVALVSLGEPRKLLLRPKGGGQSQVFKLGRGDLFVTGGQSQRHFEHSIPKVARAGPRISVAFRHGVR